MTPDRPMTPDSQRDPIDDLLDQWRVGEPSPDLASQIVARSRAVEQLDQKPGWRARLAALLGVGAGLRLVPQLAGLGLALLIGFWYGAGASTAQEFDASPLILGPTYESEWLG